MALAPIVAAPVTSYAQLSLYLMVLQRFADERSEWLRHPLPIAPVVVFEILGFPYLEDGVWNCNQLP